MNFKSDGSELETKTAAPLLIVGASARAAAYSAVRSGLKPICADLFADEDLKAVAKVWTVNRYPQDLPEVVENIPNCPWMYVGALENHPQIIAEISAHRPLWGNPAEVVLAVRDPFRIFPMLTRAGIGVPDVRPSGDPPSADGRWLLKPINSAAGRGICVWNHDNRHSKTLAEPHYFQQYLSGAPLSALFMATRSRTVLVGITRQLVGEEWLGASPFVYCGSIGPIDLTKEIQQQIQWMGTVLAKEFRLRGLFGVDFLLDGQSARPTEINPRYTASAEVLETAYEIPLLSWHSRSCVEFEFPDAVPDGPEKLRAFEKEFNTALRIVGKAILYAEEDLTVANLEERLPTETNDSIQLADIPAPGSQIKPRHPICTVFASGKNENSCLRSLRQNVCCVRDAIGSVESRAVSARSGATRPGSVR